MLELIKNSGQFKLLQANVGASELDIAYFEGSFGSSFHEYMTLVREGTELEFATVTGKYIRIHGPRRCVETYQVYDMQDKLAAAVPIGDDGSSGCIYYGMGGQGPGLYLVYYSNMCQEDAVFLSATLTDLLVRGIGTAALR